MPVEGQLLVSAVAGIAKPYHEIHRRLQAAVVAVPAASNTAVFPYQVSEGAEEVAAQALLASAMQLRLLWHKHRFGTSDPHSAELWLKGSGDPLEHMFERDALRECAEELGILAERPRFWSLLPHVCEVVQTDGESYAKRGKGRTRKRSAGIFFTPGDVATFLADPIAKASGSLLDPACGTGILLLAVLDGEQNKTVLPAALSTIAGFDVSPAALQAAAYLLAMAVSSDEPATVLKFVSQRLWCANTLKLGARRVKELAGVTNGFARAICNPPYKTNAKAATERRQPSLFADPELGVSRDLYLDFINLISDCLAPTMSTCSIITPLSLTTGKGESFRAVRLRLRQSYTTLRYLNFDRTPDSLFGDDVKVRSTIVIASRNTATPAKTCTSALVRWSSGNRAEMWGKLREVEIELAGGEVIPKLSSPLELSLLNLTHNTDLHLGFFLRRPEQHRIGVQYQQTAYNWLPVDLVCGGGPRAYAVLSPLSAEAAFAATQSRLAFWLWRVWGDGFHLTAETILRLPLGSRQFFAELAKQLDSLGKELWSTASCVRPKRNAGVLSKTLCPYTRLDIVNEIDKVMIFGLGGTETHCQFLRSFLSEVATAGRESAELRSPAHETIRLLMQGENARS